MNCLKLSYCKLYFKLKNFNLSDHFLIFQSPTHGWGFQLWLVDIKIAIICPYRYFRSNFFLHENIGWIDLAFHDLFIDLGFAIRASSFVWFTTVSFDLNQSVATLLFLPRVFSNLSLRIFRNHLKFWISH